MEFEEKIKNTKNYRILISLLDNAKTHAKDCDVKRAIGDMIEAGQVEREMYKLPPLLISGTQKRIAYGEAYRKVVISPIGDTVNEISKILENKCECKFK